jgi:alpha-beta hydrolase superfamily lysophospholipase
MLIETIAGNEFGPGEKLNIIAHSHGGNVALAASHLSLPRPIDTLITLSKPTRLGNCYVPASNIGSFYNISARGDRIQWFASDAKLRGRWSTDTHAVNLTLDTSASNLKPHAALIWDDQIRKTWWDWLLRQESCRAGSSTKVE